MPLKLHCIFNQPSVLPEIVRLVERKAHQLNAKKRSAKVEDVYRELRDDGLEIDAESVAFAYQNVKGIMRRKGFSTPAEVKRFGGEGLKKAIEIANKGDLKKAKLGKYSVNTAVASSIANTFSTLQGNNDVDTSRLKTLQDTMTKYAKSMLDKSAYPKTNTKQSFADTIKGLFDLENLSLTNQDAMRGKVKGSLNTIDQMWDAIKNDVEAISKGIKDKADRAKFDQLTDAIKNSNYEVLLSTSQADDVIKQILIDAGYAKEVNSKNGKVKVVDWNAALKNQSDWKQAFSNIFAQNGFNAAQTNRIINKLEGNYNRAIQQQAQNILDKVKKKNKVNTKTPTDAIDRLMNLRNAGIFAPNNAQYLRDALGVSMPQEAADELSEIINDYEENTKLTGKLSNVENEEVYRAIKNLLTPLSAKGMEKFVGAFSDYSALRAASTISTLFNGTQNATSGVFAAVRSAITAIIKTGNFELIPLFIKQWGQAASDVINGGVPPRDSKTVNVLEQLQGRGGLSDRWTVDEAVKQKNFLGWAKAGMNIVAQVTATAMDAANGTVIYHSNMVQAVKSILKSRGVTNVNKKIDDIIFGKSIDPFDGLEKTNRKIWTEEAMRRLENQQGVVKAKVKAGRIADELIWHQLISVYGLSIDEVKAAMSASLNQKSRDLGHNSDVFVNPSVILSAAHENLVQKAEEQKQKGNREAYAGWMAVDTVFKTMNMFVGGKANWAVLTLQNSPFGVAQGLFDIVVREGLAFAQSPSEYIKGDRKPLYRQKLVQDDPDALQKQLEARKAINGRFERGILGTLIQLGLFQGIMAIWSKGDDDDDKKEAIAKTFGDMYKDPNTKRFSEKALSSMMAAELSFAYDKDAKALNMNKISNSVFLPSFTSSPNSLFDYWRKEVLEQSTGYTQLQESFKWNSKMKDEDQKDEANGESVGQFLGGLFQAPFVAQTNIINKEVRTINRGFTPDPLERARQSAEYKKQLENIHGTPDAIMNGIVSPAVWQSIIGREKASEVKANKTTDLFFKKGIEMPKVGAKSSISLKGYKYDKAAHPNDELTDTEYKQLTEFRTNYVNETLDKFYEKGVPMKKGDSKRTIKFDKLNDEQLKQLLSKLSSKANEKAKEKLFGKKIKDKTPDESITIE